MAPFRNLYYSLITHGLICLGRNIAQDLVVKSTELFPLLWGQTEEDAHVRPVSELRPRVPSESGVSGASGALRGGLSADQIHLRDQGASYDRNERKRSDRKTIFF